MKEYPEMALRRAKDGAAEWLKGNADGYPRSWEQEAANDKRRGYITYDDWEAPPIAGYEALEREGAVVRLETVIHCGVERIHFRLKSPTVGQKEKGATSPKASGAE